jgi:hypothetical protein
MRQPIGVGLEKETFVRRSGIGSEEQPSRMDKFRSPKFSHMHAEICLFYSLLEKILLLCLTSIDHPQPLDLGCWTVSASLSLP